MFKILGSDGTEYGPVTTEQLRQWIHEGRAGGQTQVKPEGAGGWLLISTVPEFSDVFRAPPPLTGSTAPGAMPPMVRIVGTIMIAVAVVSVLRLLASYLPLIVAHGSRPTPFTSFTYFNYLSFGFGLLSVPFRIACGIGLIFGKEWARRLSIGISIVLALLGAWGLARTGQWLFSVMAGDPQFAFRSLPFLVGMLWSIAVFLFNIATVVILTRKPVRDAFAKKTSAAV